VQADEVLAPGESETQRVQQGYQQMAASQRVAPVVAERALGKHVPIARLGARIDAVVRKLPAARGGVRPGDVIVEAQGRPVHTASDLIAVTSKLSPGDRLRLRLRDAGVRTFTTVTDPNDKTRAIIGISISDAVRVGRLPVPVRFSTPGIGGPSAGLAFALEVYRSLSKDRDLLHGHKVTATGELDLDGHVYPIGGVKQKTQGAIDAGADTFLVPAGDNARDARRAAHGRLRIIAVRTFDGALRAIRALRST
jgi:Lon-like protease